MEMEMEVEVEVVMEVEVEMVMEMEMEMEFEMGMEMEMGMVEIVILKLRRHVGSPDLHRKRLLASDFQASEVFGAPKSDEESPKKLPKRHEEAPTRLLGGALGALGGPWSFPSNDLSAQSTY